MKQPLLALDWGAPKALRSTNHALKLLNPYPSFPHSSPNFETQNPPGHPKGLQGYGILLRRAYEGLSFKGLGFRAWCFYSYHCSYRGSSHLNYYYVAWLWAFVGLSM